VLPPVALNNKAPLIRCEGRPYLLLSSLNSIVSDYVTPPEGRGHEYELLLRGAITVLKARCYSPDQEGFIRCRVLELTLIQPADLNGFAIALGYAGAPFHWNRSAVS